MLNFNDHALQDSHQHRDFRSTYLCYMNHVRDCRKQDDADALRLQVTEEFIEDCEQRYNILLQKEVLAAVRARVTELLIGEVALQVEAAKVALGHNGPTQAPPIHPLPSRAASLDSRPPSSTKTNAESVRVGKRTRDCSDDENDVRTKPPSNRGGYNSDSDDENAVQTKPPSNRAPLVSTLSSRCLYDSTSRIYSWDYLVGNGRRDSDVDSVWMYNDVDISHDLMEFRNHVIQENGDLNYSHQKLAVNFVFLLEGDHRTKGLHLEIDDEPWRALCEATSDLPDRLSKETVDEALEWVQLLARGSPDTLKSRMRSTPPNDLSLRSILNLMAVSGHLWDSEPSNEDSFLKAGLGPFLSTYLGSITFTTSAWTHTHEEIRNANFNLLVPDFATVTATLQGELSLVLLEGKVAANKAFQIWDDKTKLGQEMKLALDSILLLSPGEEVCVVGILVKEPLVEFFSMNIPAEGCYVMHRFAVCHIPSDHENMISLVSMMEAFHHAKAKVIKTLTAIRQVRVRPSLNPKVPLSWLRPSYSKPTKTLVRDGRPQLHAK